MTHPERDYEVTTTLNGKPQVMVVDDDVSMLNFLRVFLTDRGYGAITGAIATVSILPRTTAPLLFALLHNAFGGYDAVILMMFAVAVVGAIAFWVAVSGPEAQDR